jgi:hypothetical protein
MFTDEQIQKVIQEAKDLLKTLPPWHRVGISADLELYVIKSQKRKLRNDYQWC